MNKFGKRLTLTTFGESHGKAIGCILDGVPAGLPIDEAYIQSELDRRKPGKSKYETPRKEDDAVEILSGVFEGKTTGTSIAMVIYNKNQKSKDYSNVKDLFRPGHGDFTYFHKYGLRDYRGGGRSSARETAARVAGGAVAKLILKELGIEVFSGIRSIGNIRSEKADFEFAKSSIIHSLDPDKEEEQKNLIDTLRKDHDSVGGSVFVKIKNAPKGLGEPMYHKLDGALADAMMGLNAVKAVEIGDGMEASKLTGSQNNDEIRKEGFLSNHAGGILAGISNGEDIDVTVYFKPTPSIFKEQKTVDTHGENANFLLEGRHDPCVAIRGSIVCESLAALVIADMLLLNMNSQIEYLHKIYK